MIDTFEMSDFFAHRTMIEIQQLKGANLILLFQHAKHDTFFPASRRITLCYNKPDSTGTFTTSLRTNTLSFPMLIPGR